MKKTFTLAESAIYGAALNSKQSFGFTLAEILITLGIIGVVAALTLPIFISNHQKQTWVNQLKRQFTLVSQGFKLAMARDGVDNLADTELFRNINGDNLKESGQDKFVTELKKYFNVIETYEYEKFPYNKTYSYLSKKTKVSVLNEAKRFSAIMNDGSYWFLELYKQPQYSSFDREIIESLGGRMFARMGQIAIDVNGEKGPNIVGRDLFQMNISIDGTIYPNNGVSHSIFAEGTNWEHGGYYWKSAPQCDPASEVFAGYGCCGRVIEEGWKMTY